MAINAGTKLGPYEIVAPLGAGGMGEVYRARDTRIGREVAIKILPSSYSEDADRLRRFELEARTAGLLNHPNLLAIYDVGKENGSPYIVSELLEGETLREKLRTGALAVRRVIEYGNQLAGGLAAAHDKGIIHRDLKPENLFLTKDGRLKILDFGLAKLHLPEPAVSEEHSQLQTVAPLSTPGMILGTMGYMSPEQVRGLAADHRSDIFALGVVLYEMLTGKRAFAGNTPADTISAILQKDPPDLAQSGSGPSPALERILRHCMEKEPDQRFQSARDVAFALEALSGTTDSQRTSEALPSLRKNRERLWKIATAICLLAALAVFAVLLLRKPPSTKLLEVSVLPSSNTSLSSFDIPQISPDGSKIAFGADDRNGKRTLWVRSFDSSQAQEMPDTDDASLAFWSPDSRWIAFFAHGKLKKIEVTGGSAETLCAVSDPRGGTWNEKGVILFAPHPGVGIYRINASGGTPMKVTSVDSSVHETSHRFPWFLPDNTHFLYFTKGSKSGIYVGSLDSPQKLFLVQTDHEAVYAPPGYLLFYQSDALVAQPFDAAKLQLQGEPFRLFQKVYFNPPMFGSRVVSVSQDGVMSFLRGSAMAALQRFDRSGKLLGSVGDSGENLFNLALSPDGKRLIVAMGLPTTDLWMYDLAGGNRSRFTFDPDDDRTPAWSFDGSKILFGSTRGGLYAIYEKNSSGTGSEELLLNSKNWTLPDDWSPDGKNILYEDIDPNTKYDIWVLPIDTKKAYPLVKGESNEAQAKFSPDGRRIAYSSDETGQPEVYVQSFQQQAAGRWQVSLNGGFAPRWRRDGKELFYLSLDKKLMAVAINAGASFEAAKPQLLFQTTVNQVQLAAFFGLYEAEPDGQSFLVRTSLGEPEAITVFFNWPLLLKRGK